MKAMTKVLTVIMVSCILLSPGVLVADETDFLAIYDPFIERYQPLAAEVERASWEARKVGSDEAFEKKKNARLALVKLYADAELYAAVSSLREDGTIQDPFIVRLARTMYDTFLPVQTDREAVEKSIELETFFEKILRNHRITVDGRPMTTGEVRRFLRSTSDSQQAEKVWKAYMKLGKSLEPKVRELVRFRNRIAEKLEQPHYFRLQLDLNKFNSTTFYRFFNFLNSDMRDPYAEVKKEIDIALATKFGIEVSELRPWHYGDLFFRDAPVTAVTDLDYLFKNVDLVKLARTYLESIELPCDDILKRSEIRTTPGGAVFPCRVGFDSDGHVRIACEVTPTALGAEDLLQALTKAVYRENMKHDVPVLLRRPPHRLIDECLGSFIGSMVRNPDFLKEVLKVDPKEFAQLKETAERTMKWRSFIRAEWAQLIMRFEVSMFGDPTRDYPQVWSNFTNTYMGITPPEEEFRYGFALVPEILFRSSTHYSTLMGDLLAEQLNDHMLREVLGKDATLRPCYAKEPKVGAFLRENIMELGDLYHWEQLVKERLGASFAKGFYLKRSFNIEPTGEFEIPPIEGVMPK